MKPRYHRIKGYRRHPGFGGRPVYLMPMSKEELQERRILYGLISLTVLIIGALAMWAVTLS